MQDNSIEEKFLENVVIAVVVAACFSAFLSENFRYNADHWIVNIYNVTKGSLTDLKVEKFLFGVFEPIIDIFGFVLIAYLYWKHKFQKRSFFKNLTMFTLLAFWPKVTFHSVQILFDVGVWWYHLIWPIAFAIIVILGFKSFKKVKPSVSLIISTYSVGCFILAIITFQSYWALLETSNLTQSIRTIKTTIYSVTIAQIYIIFLQLLFTRKNALQEKIYQKLREHLTPEEYNQAFTDLIGKIPWQIILISLILDLFIV